MGRVAFLVLLVASLCVATVEAAPSSGGGKGSSSSGGKSAAAAPKSQGRPSPSKSPAARAGMRGGAGAGVVAPRSLVGGGSPPSPKVTGIIRERETRSGPGWLGTAFLISMLSRHDLSSSDRSWIQGRIGELRAQGVDDRASEEDLLSAVKSPVKFRYAGLQPVYSTGDVVTLSIQATREGKAIPVECVFQGAHVDRLDGSANISWTPVDPGAQVLTCRANGHQERRLLRVAKAQ